MSETSTWHRLKDAFSNIWEFIYGQNASEQKCYATTDSGLYKIGPDYTLLKIFKGTHIFFSIEIMERTSGVRQVYRRQILSENFRFCYTFLIFQFL